VNKKIIFFGLVVLVLVLAGAGLAYFRKSSIMPEPPIVPEPGVTGEPTAVADENCGIENCHGLEISCGPNVAEICTMEYEIGDKCRQFARCGFVDGKCQVLSSVEFEACKACVEKCISDFGDSEAVLECEANCGE